MRRAFGLGGQAALVCCLLPLLLMALFFSPLDLSTYVFPHTPLWPLRRSSSWGSDELFRGSYAYIGAGATPADVAALATPVYAGPAEGNGGGGGGRAAPRLLFAGDSCHTTYIGTMHGAYLTGQSAAELLVQRWQAADDV